MVEESITIPQVQNVKIISDGCYFGYDVCSPFDFSIVPSFPNVFPNVDVWGDCLPRFKGNEDDNLGENLLQFRELMHQWGIVHEDALMKMFMYSLEGDACEWYKYLPASSISSLIKI